MTDPGTGSEFQPFTVEEQSKNVASRTGSEIMDVLTAAKVGRNPFTGALTAEVNDRVRRLMFSETVPNATTGERTLAAHLRRIMDRAYRTMVDRGLEIGYVENKGYLPRAVQAGEANARPDEFRTTNAAEHTAAQGAYRMFAVPAISTVLALLPLGGPIGTGLKTATMQTFTSGRASNAFANATAGAKAQSKKKAP